MIEALDHVIILVEDLEAATRSYAALLGREASWSGAHPGYGTSNALFRLDNTYIELLTADGEGPVADQVRAALRSGGEGPFGLAFRTPDAEAAHTRLSAAGLEPQPPSDGGGVDARGGSERRWRNVLLSQERTGGLFAFVIEHLSSAEALPMVAPAGDPAAAVHALDHVVIRSKDAEAAIGLFGEPGLGIRLALDKTAPEWGGRMLFYRVGGATVEVIAKSPPQTPQEGESLHSFWGIAYQVADLQAAHRRLTEAEVAVSEVRQGRKPGTMVATVKSHVHGAPTLLIGPDPAA